MRGCRVPWVSPCTLLGAKLLASGNRGGPSAGSTGKGRLMAVQV